MASNKLYLGSVAQVDGSAMSIVGGKQLLISSAPTSDNSVVNRKYIDDAVAAVQTTVSGILDGSVDSYNTLKEVKDFAQSIRDTGVSTVTAAIDAETAARIAADDVLTAAVSAEETARSNAVSAEATARSNADATLTAAVSAEVTARSNAVSAEATARSNADATLTAAVSAEVTARSNAVSDEAATRVAGDAKLNMLAVKSSKTMLYGTAVLGDSPILLRPDPLELCNYFDNPLSSAANFDGWRMKNSVTGKKFTLYIPVGSPPGVSPGTPLVPNPTEPDYIAAINSLRPYLLKVGDVKAMYLELCAISVVSMPFITIYTLPKFDGKDHIDESGSSWFRSAKTFVTGTGLVPYSNYNMVVNLKNVDTYDSPYFTRHDTNTVSSSSRNLLNMSDNDEIMYITIGSDSGSSVGNVECIIGKFKLQLESGINEFVFSNTIVFAEYMKQKQIQLWRSLFGTSATDDPFMSDYQIPAPDYSTR
jgi:hypothetical protein